MTTDLDDALARLWATFAATARTRVDVLEQYVAAGCPEQDRPGAVQAAHRLAGALGSYGRAGSEQAGRLEQLLLAEPASPEVALLVAELRLAVQP